MVEARALIGVWRLSQNELKMYIRNVGSLSLEVIITSLD